MYGPALAELGTIIAANATIGTRTCQARVQVGEVIAQRDDALARSALSHEVGDQ
jgi:hypothetical protein